MQVFCAIAWNFSIVGGQANTLFKHWRSCPGGGKIVHSSVMISPITRRGKLLRETIANLHA